MVSHSSRDAPPQEPRNPTEAAASDDHELSADLVGNVENGRRRVVLDQVALVIHTMPAERILGITQIHLGTLHQVEPTTELLGK